LSFYAEKVKYGRPSELHLSHYATDRRQKTMTTKTDLLAARAKITDESNWTQGVMARDANGDDKPRSHPLADDIHWEGIDGRYPQACQWCALGAVQAVTTTIDYEQDASSALNAAARHLHGGISIASVNDELGHAAVLACFDKAIKDAS
jgi:hypothetical protein